MNSETGEETSFLPISDPLGFAEEEGIAVTIVLPTRHFLSDEVDENGNENTGNEIFVDYRTSGDLNREISCIKFENVTYLYYSFH